MVPREGQQQPSKPSSGPTRDGTRGRGSRGCKPYSRLSQTKNAPSDKPQEEKGEEVLTVRCKTPSVYTSLVVVPGLYSPEMDLRGVPDTPPHSTSTHTQARFTYQRTTNRGRSYYTRFRSYSSRTFLP